MTEHTLPTLWMILAGKPGSSRVYRLLLRMSPREALQANKKELIQKLGEADAGYFLNKDLTAAKKLLEDCREKGIRICCYSDPDYPPMLREIPDPPPALFYYGQLPDADDPMLGIVGTRNCSDEAMSLAARFSGSLSESGFRIVSGMANGVDTYAHKGAILRGFASYAVLGCGVDRVYPKENQRLYNTLKKHGGLISEYLPGTPPLAGNFPRRNRIISGLSHGVLVVECPVKSGSMITARYAVEQNRTLFAIPASPEDPRHTGTNALLKSGAIFTTEPNDIVEEFRPLFGNRLRSVTIYDSVKTEEAEKPRPQKTSTIRSTRRPYLSPEETKIYTVFREGEPLSLTELCDRIGQSPAEILPILQAMEFSGYLKIGAEAKYALI